MGSRGIYHEGWLAGAAGPVAAMGCRDCLRHGHLDARRGRLGALQPRRGLVATRRLTAERPGKSRPDARFMVGGCEERGAPQSAAACGVPVYHPELRRNRLYREWDFAGDMTRMPEFCAPALGTKEQCGDDGRRHPQEREGAVRVRVGAGGLTCCRMMATSPMSTQLFLAQRTKIVRRQKVSAGPDNLVVTTTHTDASPAGARHTVTIDGGSTVAAGKVPVSVPILFTANDCLDIRTCLGSPVSMDYRMGALRLRRAIHRVHVACT